MTHDTRHREGGVSTTKLDTTSESSFVSSLQCSLEARIRDYAEKMGEELISDYQSKLKKRMSDLLASLSIELLRMVTIERNGNELVIRVQTEWSKP